MMSAITAAISEVGGSKITLALPSAGYLVQLVQPGSVHACSDGHGSVLSV